MYIELSTRQRTNPTTFTTMPVSSYMCEPYQNHLNSTKQSRVHNITTPHQTMAVLRHDTIKAKKRTNKNLIPKEATQGHRHQHWALLTAS